MPGYKISELPAASGVADTDELPANQAGTTRKITLEQIMDDILSNIPSASGADVTITTDTLTNLAGYLIGQSGTLSSINASDVANDILPSQTSNSGKYLRTNGSNVAWEVVPSGGGSASGSSVTLTTDTITNLTGYILGEANTLSVISKSNVLDDILPTQSGNSGKALVTNGTTASWQTVSGSGGGGGSGVPINYGTINSLPLSPVDKELYFPTDSVVLCQYQGSEWHRYFGGIPLGEPLPAINTLNQTGNASGWNITETSGHVVFKKYGVANDDCNMYTEITPNTKYRLTVGLIHGYAEDADAYCMNGIGCIDGTGKIKHFNFRQQTNSNSNKLNVRHYSSPTSGDSENFNSVTQSYNEGLLRFWRIENNGINRTYLISSTGLEDDFTKVYQEDFDEYITETEVGLVLNPYNGHSKLTWLSWKLEDLSLIPTTSLQTTSGFATSSDTGLPDNDDNWSVCISVFVDSYPGSEACFVSWGTHSFNQAACLLVNNSRQLSFTNIGSSWGGGVIPLQSWAEVAAVYNGSTLKLYINGIEVYTGSLSGLGITLNGDLYLGTYTNETSNLSGRVKNLEIYSQVLTPTEILERATTGTVAAYTPIMTKILNGIISESVTLNGSAGYVI